MLIIRYLSSPITRQPGGPLDPVLARIGTRIGATPAQVIFAWLKSKNIVIVTCVHMHLFFQSHNSPSLSSCWQDDNKGGTSGRISWDCRFACVPFVPLINCFGLIFFSSLYNIQPHLRKTILKILKRQAQKVQGGGY